MGKVNYFSSTKAHFPLILTCSVEQKEGIGGPRPRENGEMRRPLIEAHFGEVLRGPMGPEN